MIKKTTLLAVLGIALLSLPLQAQDINKKQSAPKVSSMSRPRTAHQTTLKPSAPQHSTPGTNSKATKVPSSGKAFRFALQPSQPRKTADCSARFTQPAKSYRSSLLLTAGEQVDEHGIIVQPGEGVRKVYTRSGRCIRDVNHEVMSDIDQSGTIQIVECEDGTVYIRNIVSGMPKGTWVKGTREGNTLSVPIGQTVYYSPVSDETCSIYWGINDMGYSRYDGYSDHFTFTVDDEAGTYTLEGTSSYVFMGVFWDADGSFSFAGDWESVWTYDHDYTPLPVSTATPPAGLSTTTWNSKGHTRYTGEEYRNETIDFFKGTVTIGFDGQDVYVKGLIAAYPDSWMKGTIDGETVTFSGLQTLSTSGDAPVYGVGSDGSDLCDFVMHYDAAQQLLTSENILLANSALEDIADEVWIDDITLQPSDFFPPIETLPYTNGFDTRDDWEWFTVVNANEDDHTWRYYEQQGRYYYDNDNAADDWLLSPLIKLEAGKRYRFSIDTHCYYDNEQMEVFLGKAVDTEAMTQEVIPSTMVDWEEYQAVQNDDVRVSQDGYYCFGIHCITEAYHNVLLVDNFLVEEIVETAPAAVTDLTLTADENSPIAYVRFTAPTNNIMGDALTSNMTHIDLLRDGSVITSFEDVAPGTVVTYTDNAEDLVAGPHTYQVIAYNADGQGEKSEVVSINLLQVMEVPYVADFSDENTFNQFTCIDANDDYFTWNWNSDYGYAFYSYHSENQADDYLISSPILLEGGKNYTITVDAGSMGYPERFEVLVGKSPTVEGLTDKVIEDAVVTDEDHKTFDELYTAPEDGRYYVAIHCISDPDLYELWIHELRVEVGPENTAPAAPELSVVADAGGLLRATIEVTAPGTTLGGDALSEALDKIEIYRDGELVGEVSQVAPGSTVTYVDEAIPAIGTYNYSAVCYNITGMGKKSVAVSVYIGVDMPMDVDYSTINAVDQGSSVLLTWDKVGTIGKNGQYVNPALVDYMVYNTIEEWYGYTLDSEPLAVLRDADCYEIEYNTDEGEQMYKYWAVKTANEAGENEEGSLGHLLVGKAYDLPVVEGFAEGYIHYLWTTDALVLKSQTSTDTDGMSVVLVSSEAGTQDMLSGKLNLNDALNPTLLFDAAGFGVGTVSVMGSTDGNAPTTLLGTYSIDNGFSTVKVPLKVLQGGRYAQISLVFDIETPTEIDDWTGEILSEGDGLMIDNIRIVDLYEHNLAVSVEAPSALQAGKQGIATATVTNWGEQAASGYTVTISSDGEALLSETVTTVLAPFQSARYTVDLSASIFESGMEKTLKAEVTYADEQVPEDNAAETHYLIKEPTVKSPEQLTATDKDGAGVDLSWEAPTVEMIDYVEEFDDTEAFPTFSDGGINETEHHGVIGEWTLYDGNGLGVYSWQDPRVVYDNKYEATAWIPFDLAKAGFTDEVGHSGTQVMLSMCPSEADASGQLPAADHWLISPELPGSAQEISFYLRAITNQYGSESVEVWASSTDNQPESFELIEQYLTDATEWTQLFAQMPEGTKYFAIRHTSTDIFGVMIDDVSFRYNGGTVKNYNIYYEGTLLATVEGGVTTYHVSPDLIEVGERTFSVSAVYANGQESKPVSATILVTTDIHELTVGQQPIDIYTIDGKLVRSSATSLDGLRGIYVVNGKKVMINGR